jgi:DNA adenine methylase
MNETLVGGFDMLKWHGGKEPIAGWIRSHFKPHKHYVEPYAGGLAVLLAGLPAPAISEVVNDCNQRLINFWRVVAHPEDRLQFASVVTHLPVSEALWRDALTGLGKLHPCDHIDAACWFFIHCRQSMAGRMSAWHPLSKTRTRRGINEQVSAWQGAVDDLETISYRLQRVALRCGEAIDVMVSEDSKHTLHYLDPPYLQSTRAAKEVYEHEMTEYQHLKMLMAAKAMQGQVFISGYCSELYDYELSKWKRHELKVANHAASGSTKRTMTECLWEKP